MTALDKELNQLKATALDGLEPWAKQFEQHVPVKRLQIQREGNQLNVRESRPANSIACRWLGWIRRA